MQQIAGVLEVDPVILLSFYENFVFNNCSQPQGKLGTINNYSGLAETERKALLNRIQQLEKENDALRNGKS